ncbi:MAG: hypothetical protein ACKORJ_02965, partial [Bacteroidota bacterium]
LFAATLAGIFLAAACSGNTTQEKVEKEVKVEMTVSGDSAAEATVTVTTDSAGNEVQTIKVIKGTPESVKTTVSKLRN